MGAKAYRLLEPWRPDPGTLIEIGSERGEGSTRWLYRYAQTHGLRFVTVDIDPRQQERAEKIAPGCARHATGAQVLKRLRSRVSVAYMDGFDWIPRDAHGKTWIRRQQFRYRRLGFEMNNDRCQQEHLAEAEVIARKASEGCMVVCDDTWAGGGGWTGKGGLAVPFLTGEGFEVVASERPAGKSLGFVFLRRG